MILIAAVELALGYLLLYAGIADNGKHALSPWDGLTD